MTSTSSKNIQQLANRAQRFLEIGDIHQAEMLCDEAMNQGATDPDMLLQIGKVRYFRKRYEEAVDFFQQVLQSRPEDCDVRIMLWASYRDGGDFEGMLNLAHQFQNKPLNANEVLFAYRSFLAACDWQSAKEMQARVFNLIKEKKIRCDLIPALLIELCGISDLAPDLVLDFHRQWGDEMLKGIKPYFPVNAPAPVVTGRLKIAYLSSDFKLHPVGFYMNQILRSHDNERFEVYCYAHLGRDDAMTQHIRENVDHFIDITALTNENAAARIHADGIHILIDLNGHTTDTRLPVLAYRPAPVQMTYLGYPNTTGLATVDYRITDHDAECEEGTRYVEKLLYMPQSFLCFGVDLKTEGTHIEEGDHITFASFNNIRKITPEVIQVWSRILNRVPASTLALKAKNLDNTVVSKNLLHEFAKHGIEAERIEFRPYTRTYEEHIIQYCSSDIALDTFPYNGTTTTCEALVMGVPVVTLTGKTHAQRVSCSILKNIGFEETITHSMDAYVDKAVALASNRQGLAALRQILPTLFRHSILCQPEDFTRQLEDLYLQAWHEKTAALPEASAVDTRYSESERQEKPKATCGNNNLNDKKDISMTSPINPRTLIADIVHHDLAGTPIIIAEIGARILDAENNVGEAEIFHTLPAAKVLAFEADAEACEQINALSSHFAADIKAYPYALSDKPGEKTLYITREKMCSSLYKPNEKMLARYANLDYAYLDKTCSIEVTSLDRFMEQENIPNIDFIKIDVQGAELDIFKGASKAMPQLLGLCTEVEFVELYEGQPLFGEIDALLRTYDLQFYCFRDTGNRPIQGTAFHSKPQLLWADAVYFPSLEAIDRLPAEKLLKLSVLSSLYDAYDLSQYALKRFDDISGTHLMDDFVRRLTALAQGTNTEGDSIPADKKVVQMVNKPEATRQDLQTGNGRKAVKIENDILVTVPDDLTLMTPYILEEQQDWFEDEIEFVRRLIRPGMNVIDIGANYGCYALTIAKLAGPDGRLWAFEPCSSTADHLQQSINANGLDQIQLIRAALSNRQGEACLSTQDNAELNSLSDDNGGTDSETVPLYRLDDCMQEHAWHDIEFLKLDAEGEEVRILEGGQAFFTDLSPLVMFELKHGDEVNEGLIQAFQNMGYSPYKLIPGLMLLAPFDVQEEADPFQLNLFCCKPDRAQKLQNLGLLLLDEPASIDTACDSNIWENYLHDFPYAAIMFSTCRGSASQQPLPDWPEYRDALNAYVMAQDTERAPGERYHLLRTAFIQLVSVLDAHTSLPRLLSLARIASELGNRALAVNILNELARHFEEKQQFNVDEPFLAISARAAAIDPKDMLGNWCLAQILAERERLHAFSSYFTDASSLPILDIIERLDYPDPEMALRGDLIRQRFGLSATALAA